MVIVGGGLAGGNAAATLREERSEEHTSELQSQSNLVCRLLLEKKNNDLVNIEIRTNFDSVGGIHSHQVLHEITPASIPQTGLLTATYVHRAAAPVAGRQLSASR